MANRMSKTERRKTRDIKELWKRKKEKMKKKYKERGFRKSF